MRETLVKIWRHGDNDGHADELCMRTLSDNSVTDTGCPVRTTALKLDALSLLLTV